jgi:hypothetical protein
MVNSRAEAHIRKGRRALTCQRSYYFAHRRNRPESPTAAQLQRHVESLTISNLTERSPRAPRERLLDLYLSPPRRSFSGVSELRASCTRWT